MINCHLIRDGLIRSNSTWAKGSSSNCWQAGKKLAGLYSRRKRQLETRRKYSDIIVEQLLGTEYAIPKDVQLEIMSPALRVMPQRVMFFTKTMAIGIQLLDLHCQGHMLSRGSTSRNQINGLDFDRLQYDSSINSRQNLEEFVSEFGLTNALVTRSNTVPFDTRGAAVESLFLLIGTVYSFHGSSKVYTFIRDRIITGRSGLYRLHSRSI
jgi:hypothetical protein